MTEKIQKILAGAGIGSRREIEDWIREGRISVNGKLAILGTRITLEDRVRIDGKEVRLNPHRPPKSRVLLYHKPEGEICSRRDPEGRPSVFDHLPLLRNGRWVSIGRLDFNTSGILLFTNDGELAHQLMHPSSNIEREYAVRVQGQVSPDMLAALKKGVTLEDGPARFLALSDQGGEGSNHWYHVTVEQGRNRIVRRMFESMDVMVSRLIRIRFGTLMLPRLLRRGKWAELTLDDITRLLNPPEPVLQVSRNARNKPPKKYFSGKNPARPSLESKRDGARPMRDSKPAGRPFQSRRDEAPARRDTRPGNRPFTGKRDSARPERDRPFAGKREGARPERDGKPSGRSFHSRQDESPARRDARPGSRPFSGKRDSARSERDRPFAGKRDGARPQRDGKPAGRPFHSRRDESPARRDGKPGGRPFTGKRDSARSEQRDRPFAGKRDGARPQRDGKPAGRPFHSRRDESPARRDGKPGARPFAGKRDGARPQRDGKPAADRSLAGRFSDQARPRNKITRWEKYPGTAGAQAPRRPRPATHAGAARPNTSSARPGLQRRTTTASRPAKPNHPVLKLRRK